MIILHEYKTYEEIMVNTAYVVMIEEINSVTSLYMSGWICDMIKVSESLDFIYEAINAKS